MAAQQNSPNWAWLRLGYTIVRNGHHRTIIAPGGSVVPVNGYDEEIAWLRAAGAIDQDETREAA